MDCEAARAQLADRLTATAGPGASAALEEHLRTCAACAREAQEIGETWVQLADVPPMPPDSASMRARFDAIVHPATASPRAWMMYGLQAAAAIVLLAGGFIAGRQTSPAPVTDPAIAELREELRATRQLVSLSLLQQQSASERLRGITYTTQIERPGGELVSALLDTLLHDPDPNVRLRSVEALKRFADRDNVRRAAADALTEPASSPLVQIALIDFLVEANVRSSAASLRQVVEDAMTDKAVRAHAAWGLQQIG
jgi:HEAT repeat